MATKLEKTFHFTFTFLIYSILVFKEKPNKSTRAKGEILVREHLKGDSTICFIILF
jgi:hypothetical protein